MRLSRFLLVTSLLLVPAAAQALVVDPGGPWNVPEGETIDLAVVVEGAVGEVHYAWDIDGDDRYDDSAESHATFSAIGVDGPSDGFTVGLVVTDSVDQVLVQIPVNVRNTGPTFQNVHDSRAIIGREWTWTPDVVDVGGDTFELSVDDEDMPVGMVFDELENRFTWTPTVGHVLQGDPPGHFELVVTAEDEDGGRTRYTVTLDVVENQAPPTPGLAYPNPDRLETILSRQPTFILSNVDDPDGDALTYWIAIDSNICFCSPDRMQSGPIEEGVVATEWPVPSPLDVEVGVAKSYYLRRWTNDGIADSPQIDSVFEVLVSDGPVDGDGGADAAAGGDGGPETGDSGDSDGCACAVGPGATDGQGLLFVALSMIGLMTFRRLRS